jgi:hypothetical protein
VGLHLPIKKFFFKDCPLLAPKRSPHALFHTPLTDPFDGTPAHPIGGLNPLIIPGVLAMFVSRQQAICPFDLN